MSETGDLTIRLLPPGTWQPLEAAAFERLAPLERRIAASVVTALHDRHVGITPELAAGLVPLLFDPAGERRVKGAWAAVRDRLLRELAPEESPAEGSARPLQARYGLLLSAAPTYTLLRLVAPLVDAACRLVGEVYLFCEDEIPSGEAGDYETHARRLAAAVEEITRADGGSFELFWKERGLTLSTLARGAPSPHHGLSELPEIEPDAFGTLWRLAPEMPRGEAVARSRRRLAPWLKRQQSRLKKEVGVDGIQVTRRTEDLGRILLSELMYPRPLLADRLLNSGYLALERPPKPEKLRDVLVAGLMPAALRGTPAADLVKACWFDCMMRLSLFLRQNRLLQSEFRWIEADSFHRWRSSTFLLRDLPHFDGMVERRVSPGYRRQFLAGLRWLPAYLDSRGRFRATRAPADPLTDPVETAQRWAFAAWHEQKEAPGQHSYQAPDATPLHADDFAFVHLMVFLPAGAREARGEGAFEGLVSRLHAGFRLGAQPGRFASVTWVPDSLAGSEGWAFAARGRPAASLWTASPEALDAAGLSGGLIQTWLDELLKEMRGA